MPQRRPLNSIQHDAPGRTAEKMTAAADGASYDETWLTQPASEWTLEAPTTKCARDFAIAPRPPTAALSTVAKPRYSISPQNDECWAREAQHSCDRFLRSVYWRDLIFRRGGHPRRIYIRPAILLPANDPDKWLDQLFAGADQRLQPLGQQGGVERLLERLIDRRAIEADRLAVIRQQGD